MGFGEALGLFATAGGLGFAYAALPGAVNAEALRRGAAGGFARSFWVHAGAMIGAGCWAVLALAGASLLARFAGVTTVLGLAGALFLLRLAFVAGRAALEPPTERPAARSGDDFTVGLVVGIANPAGLPFWTGLASDVVGKGGDALTGHRTALFVAGVLLGSIAWGGLLSTLVGWGRRWLRPGFFRAVNAFCAVAFAFFALRLIWSALG